MFFDLIEDMEANFFFIINIYTIKRKKFTTTS